jgi:hypothetical protein
MAWMAVMGPGRGKAAVYVDGVYVKTVDLYASSYRWAVVYQKTWSTLGTHTIRVKVLGTSGRPYVDIDGFGILR